MKMLLTADVHASNNLPHARVVKGVVTDRLYDVIKLLWAITFAASEHKCEEIWVLGDLFDKRLLDGATISLVTRWLKKASELMPIVIVPGNHEATDAACRMYVSEYLDNLDRVYVIDKPTAVLRGDKWFHVCPYMRLDDHVKALAELADDDHDAKVLFTHQAVKGAVQNNYESPIGLAQDVLKPWKMVVLGDFHNEQRVGNARYLGSPYQINFGETPDKFVWIFDTDKLKLTPLPTTFPRFESHTIEWPDEFTMSGLTLEQVLPDFQPDTYYRVTIEGEYARNADLRRLSKLATPARLVKYGYAPTDSQPNERRSVESGVTMLNEYIDRYVDSHADGEKLASQLKELGRSLCSV